MIKDLVSHVAKGQPIRAEHWNRMVDMVSALMVGKGLYLDANGVYGRKLGSSGKGSIEVAVADSQISGDDAGNFTVWTIGSSGLEATTDVLEATDLYGSGAVTGELAELFMHSRTGKRVFKLSTWIRRVKPTVNITSGSTGNASVWINSADSGDDINITLDWMEGASQISLGKEIEVHYKPKRKLWSPQNAECET